MLVCSTISSTRPRPPTVHESNGVLDKDSVRYNLRLYIFSLFYLLLPANILLHTDPLFIDVRQVLLAHCFDIYLE